MALAHNPQFQNFTNEFQNLSSVKFHDSRNLYTFLQLHSNKLTYLNKFVIEQNTHLMKNYKTRYKRELTKKILEKFSMEQDVLISSVLSLIQISNPLDIHLIIQDGSGNNDIKYIRRVSS